MVGKTILIVDKNPASRAFLAKYLRAKQFDILEAPTGKEALILAWHHEPDLVLFDPTLTDIPDKEFIQRLRNDARTVSVRLVALSSDPSAARRETRLKASQRRAWWLPTWSCRLVPSDPLSGVRGS